MQEKVAKVTINFGETFNFSTIMNKGDYGDMGIMLLGILCQTEDSRKVLGYFLDRSAAANYEIQPEKTEFEFEYNIYLTEDGSEESIVSVYHKGEFVMEDTIGSYQDFLESQLGFIG